MFDMNIRSLFMIGITRVTKFSMTFEMYSLSSKLYKKVISLRKSIVFFYPERFSFKSRFYKTTLPNAQQ